MTGVEQETQKKLARYRTSALGQMQMKASEVSFVRFEPKSDIAKRSKMPPKFLSGNPSTIL
jgi:hypothetical protein